jgi:hypothetical protein
MCFDVSSNSWHSVHLLSYCFNFLAWYFVCNTVSCATITCVSVSTFRSSLSSHRNLPHSPISYLYFYHTVHVVVFALILKVLICLRMLYAFLDVTGFICLLWLFYGICCHFSCGTCMWLIAFMVFNNIYKPSSLRFVFTYSAVLVNSDLYVASFWNRPFPPLLFYKCPIYLVYQHLDCEFYTLLVSS